MSSWGNDSDASDSDTFQPMLFTKGVQKKIEAKSQKVGTSNKPIKTPQAPQVVSKPTASETSLTPYGQKETEEKSANKPNAPKSLSHLLTDMPAQMAAKIEWNTTPYNPQASFEVSYHAYIRRSICGMRMFCLVDNWYCPDATLHPPKVNITFSSTSTHATHPFLSFLSLLTLPSLPFPSLSPVHPVQSMNVSDWLVRILRTMSITRPTEIQQRCIPIAFQGRDIIGRAKTGSGKTAAFAIPILQQLAKDPYGVFALVLTPTRELAIQIADQFHALGKPIALETSVIVGGLDVMRQMAEVGLLILN